MSAPREQPLARTVREQHASPSAAGSPQTPPLAPVACARCAASLRLGAAGRPRRGTRYCSRACRQAATRDQRAVARADLLAALGELAAATSRVEAALKVMGFRPQRPRRRVRPTHDGL